LKTKSPANQPETNAAIFAVNKRLQRTRGTIHAASVSAMALALEAKRYVQNEM